MVGLLNIQVTSRTKLFIIGLTLVLHTGQAQTITSDSKFSRADSLFEDGKIPEAVLQFRLAEQGYRKERNLGRALTCLDAQRVCWESIGNWSRAYDVAKRAYTLNADSLKNKFDFKSTGYRKNSAFAIQAESIAYFRKLLAILNNWRSADEETSRINWIIGAGSQILKEKAIANLDWYLKESDLLLDSVTLLTEYKSARRINDRDMAPPPITDLRYKKLEKWLRRFLNLRIDEIQPRENKRTSGSLFYAKSQVHNDSSLWYFFRAGREWIQSGGFSDDKYLSYIAHSTSKEAQQLTMHRLLGWYYEQQLNFDLAAVHYSSSAEEENAFMLRKARAFKNGQLKTRKLIPKDTAKAYQLVRKATKNRRRENYLESAGQWRQAALEFQKFNCWNSVYRSALNASIDGMKEEYTSVIAVESLDFPLNLAAILYPETSLEFASKTSQIGEILLAKNENHRAFDILSKAIATFELNPKKDPVRMARLYAQIGNASKNLGDAESAIRYHEKSLSEYKRIGGTATSIILSLHMSLSEEYIDAGEYSEARRHLDWLYASNDVKRDASRLIPSMKFLEGRILLMQGNRKDAIRRFEEALSSLDDERFRKAFEAFRLWEEQGGTIESATFQAADVLFDSLHTKVDLRLRILNTMIRIQTKGETDRGLNYLREVKSALRNLILYNDISTYTRIESANLLASEVLRLADAGHPLPDWIKVDDGLAARFGEENNSIAWNYHSYAIRLNTMNNYNARDNTEAQVENPPLGLRENPNINSYQFGDLLLDSYLGRARIHFRSFEIDKDSSDLFWCQRIIVKCDSILERARRSYTNESSKLKLAELGAQVYEMGTYVSILLAASEGYERETAFAYMEKGKSNVLRQSMAEVKAQYFSGVPDSLINHEKRIKTRLFELQRKLAENRMKPKLSEAGIDSLHNQVFDWQEAQLAFAADLKRDYPQYFTLKRYDDDIKKSWELGEKIKGDEALVEYLVGDDHIFVAVVTRDAPIHFITVKNDTLLNKYVHGLRNSLTFELRDEFIRTSNWLYEKLFAGVDQHLAKSGIVKKLIIIPDNVLGYIPFEVLLTQTSAKEYRDLPYLIKKYEIRYAYSADMFVAQALYRPEVRDSTFVAFAPVFNNSNKTNFLVKSCEQFYEGTEKQKDRTRAFSPDGRFINPLPFTEDEVKAIVNKLQAKDMFTRYFIFKDAREEELKSADMATYKYIHLATHGIINDHFPAASGLILSQDSTSKEDGILYTAEIYSMRLNADMVVLSACETGLGKVVKGEGIIGLTRGWFYAGAKTLVVSLWKVADHSTSQLMVRFYDALFAGKSKADAMRQTKLEMIKGADFAAPYYWAPFIIIGN